MDQRKAAVWEWFSVFTLLLLGEAAKAALYPATPAEFSPKTDHLRVRYAVGRYAGWCARFMRFG